MRAKEEMRRLAKLVPSLDPVVASERSRSIASRIGSHPSILGARTIGIFFPLPGEVDLTSLWKLFPGKCVFPRVAAERMSLAFFAVTALSDLKPGYAKIPEPQTKTPCAVWRVTDVILVPGICFDRLGGRIGSGKGFYDRFLSGVSATPWGVCFKEQIVDEALAQEDTDVRMGALASDEGVYEVMPLGKH